MALAVATLQCKRTWDVNRQLEDLSSDTSAARIFWTLGRDHKISEVKFLVPKNIEMGNGTRMFIDPKLAGIY